MKARVADRDMPTYVDVHPTCDPPSWSPLGSDWHLAIESVLPSPFPTDGEWDNDDWDTDLALWVDGDTATIYFDVIGDVQGFQLRAGRDDPEGDMEAATLELTLNNKVGLYTQFGPDGTLRSYPPGQRVWLWVDHDGVTYPLFGGVVETWEENLADEDQPFATVDVECVDLFLKLNTERDAAEYMLGSEGQRPSERLSFLTALAAYDGPTRFDLGDVTLRAIESTNSLLEEMHHTAHSDGGVLFVDTDGTLLYLGRTRMAGRPDQGTVPFFSDRCDTGLAAWAGDPVTDATMLANAIQLKNVDDVVARAQDDVSVDLHRARRLALDGHLWRTLAEGQALAQFLLTWRANGYFTLPELGLIPTAARPELYPVVYSLRIGDRVTVERTLPNAVVITWEALVDGLLLEVTAEGGLEATYTTSQAVA